MAASVGAALKMQTGNNAFHTGSQINMKHFYTTVFCQAFSSCGKYLAGGTSYGELVCFNIANVCADDDDESDSKRDCSPFFRFQAHQDIIYSMSTSGDLLLTGASGEIHAWSWSDIKKRCQKLLFSFSISQGNALCRPEVNCLSVCGEVDSPPHLLFAGCGNNRVYCWDIETRTLLNELNEHSEYIHALTLNSTCEELFTGSEDGSVKRWDVRNLQRSIQTLEPYKKENLARPKLGKFVGCVRLNPSDSWLLIGGGPMLSVWHTKTYLPTTVLSHLPAAATAGQFLEDTIVGGGDDPCAFHWSFTGELIAKVPTSSASLYSIELNDNKQHRVLSLAGASSKIEVCTGNFLYKNFSLEV